MTKQFEELRQAYKELLEDNQRLIANNRKLYLILYDLRKEVTELKQLNDGYVKIIAKNQETNNKLMASVQKQTGGDYISRADAIEAVCRTRCGDKAKGCPAHSCLVIEEFDAIPSADAVHGWRIGKPTEQGKYMVTLDSFGHKHIDLFYYGKPMMPNCKVRGKCWYRSDDEWGDVVYDDKDILAWQPLPKPYECSAIMKGGGDE